VTILIVHQRLVQILAEVVSGLAALHKAKIIHRDVKPENVFVFKKTHCKIGDFSISKEMEGTFVKASTQAGTPFYGVSL
jgi:NIMA (never in mitosis gene a)-related kinase